MEKKLTAQGPRDRKSYTVTLPIEWIKLQGLDKTRAVELNIVGNKVIISSHKEKDSRVMINGHDYSKSIIKVLQGLYRKGVNEIKLFVDNNKIIEEAINIIDTKLIGYEVIEQKKNYIIIKDITKESEEDFKTVLRRIFLLLLELSDCNDKIQISTLDRNMKKFINYCQRILIKKGHIEFQKTPLYYLILDRLEKIKDEYKWLLPILLSNKKPTHYLKEVNDLLRIAYELFYKFDALKFNISEFRTYELKEELRLGSNLRYKVDVHIIHLHNLARLLNSLYGDIFAVKYDEENKLE